MNEIKEFIYLFKLKQKNENEERIKNENIKEISELREAFVHYHEQIRKFIFKLKQKNEYEKKIKAYNLKEISEMKNEFVIILS